MKRMDGMAGTAGTAASARIRARDWLQRPYFWSKKLERPGFRAPEELRARSEREFLHPDAALLKLASVETGRHNDSFQRADSRADPRRRRQSDCVDLASFARRRLVLFCFAVTWINNDRASVSSSSRHAASPRIDKTETTVTMKITTSSSSSNDATWSAMSKNLISDMMRDRAYIT